MIAIVGQLPPPINGLTYASQQMAAEMRDVGLEVVLINTGPSTSVAAAATIRRIRRLISAVRSYWEVVHLILTRYTDLSVIYLPLSGSVGQLLELPLVLIGRVFRLKLVIHHHSFAYLRKRKVLMSLMSFLCGRSTTHIVLSETMSIAISTLYRVGRVEVISNAAFLPNAPARRRTKHDGITLGYLGNISQQKGIGRFLSVCSRLQESSLQFDARVAGPFVDRLTEISVKRAADKLAGIILVGPVYGDDKARFFEDIDLLLFPSSYINEAEPFTILEALASGVPVIAIATGCVPDVLRFDARLLTNIEDFVLKAEELALLLATQPEVREHCRSDAVNRFAAIRSESRTTLINLLDELRNV